MLTSSRTPTSVSSAHVAPGGGWWIIPAADVRMRSEHMEKLRRRADQAYVSNPESGFDPAQPWDWVFALAARGRDFWTAHVKDRADQFMHHLKSKNDIIGLDAIAAAGEDGECRLDDKPNRTNRPSGSKRRQSRAVGRLGSDGDFETTRKRGKGSGGLGSAVAAFISAKSASKGQETAVAQTDFVMMDDYTSVNTVGVHGTDLSSTQAAVGRVRQRARSWVRRRRGSESLAQ